MNSRTKVKAVGFLLGVRQDDVEFLTILNAARVGELLPSHIACLQEQVVVGPLHLPYPCCIAAATNEVVREYNALQLATHVPIFIPRIQLHAVHTITNQHLLTPADIDAALHRFDNMEDAPRTLTVAVYGPQPVPAMVTQNLNPLFRV